MRNGFSAGMKMGSKNNRHAKCRRGLFLEPGRKGDSRTVVHELKNTYFDSRKRGLESRAQKVKQVSFGLSQDKETIVRPKKYPSQMFRPAKTNSFPQTFLGRFPLGKRSLPERFPARERKKKKKQKKTFFPRKET